MNNAQRTDEEQDGTHIGGVDMDPYEKLGNAVVLQAVKDWRDAVKRLKKNPKNFEADNMKKDCEKFFLSQHFSIYTDLDGEALLHQLKKEESL
jgi:hypothetical protein